MKIITETTNFQQLQKLLQYVDTLSNLLDLEYDLVLKIHDVLVSLTVISSTINPHVSTKIFKYSVKRFLQEIFTNLTYK